MENLTKLTRNQLATQILELQKQNEQLNLAVTNTVNIANYFGSELQKIDNFIMASPFKDNIKVNFLWVVRNWSAVVELIKLIVEVIKEVKRRIEDLKKQQEPNASTV